MLDHEKFLLYSIWYCSASIVASVARRRKHFARNGQNGYAVKHLPLVEEHEQAEATPNEMLAVKEDYTEK